MPGFHTTCCTCPFNNIVFGDIFGSCLFDHVWIEPRTTIMQTLKGKPAHNTQLQITQIRV